jgi:RimJ/RimL family protein N-acetyltransferase
MNGALFAAPGIFVRELEPGDDIKLAQWPDTVYLGSDGHHWGSDKNARDNLEELKLLWSTVTVVCNADNGQPLGLLVWSDEPDGGCRFGLELAPDRIGRGIGRQLVISFIEFAFGILGYTELRAKVSASNAPAVSLGRQLNFHLVDETFDVTPRCKLPVFTDKRYKGIREHFRSEGGIVLERVLELGLDVQNWHPSVFE